VSDSTDANVENTRPPRRMTLMVARIRRAAENEIVVVL
jgi:hypothetical protein